MSKRKHQVDQLSKSVMSFQKLKETSEHETAYMKKLYRSIKEQCLVMVYMSPKIRQLISEEELSGFIIYLEERLKSIVLNYNPARSDFENFFMKVSSFRAINYLAKIIREKKTDFALSRFAYLEEQARILEKDNYLFIDDQECPKDDRTINILRYICTKRTSFQKRLFIYVLSFVPTLGINIVEEICESFNVDIEETLTIANKINEKALQVTINSKKRYLSYRNKNWSKLLYTQLELEQVCEKSKLEILQKKEQIYMDNNESINTKLATLRKKMNYTHISDVLKIPVGTISSTVYLVKNVLMAIGTDSFETIPERHGLVKLIQDATEVKELPLFSPFKVFGINGSGEEVEE